MRERERERVRERQAEVAEFTKWLAILLDITFIATQHAFTELLYATFVPSSVKFPFDFGI
jgi:hypothetical protein